MGLFTRNSIAAANVPQPLKPVDQEISRVASTGGRGNAEQPPDVRVQEARPLRPRCGRHRRVRIAGTIGILMMQAVCRDPTERTALQS